LLYHSATSSPSLTVAAVLLSASIAAAQEYLPDHVRTPGVINPDVTQDNLAQTVCVSGWTKTIRPAVAYTNRLKLQQMHELGLQGTPQEPAWHPEGDVFIHTCHACDSLVRLPGWQSADEETRIVYSLAILVHDFGKSQTTQTALKDGVMRIISPGHEEISVTLGESFLNRINAPNAIRERVLPLVRNHMAHLQIVTDRSVRRLAKRLEPETIQGLSVVMTADAMGRPPLPPKVPEVVTGLLAKAAELQVQASAPKPILMGRHLLEIGMKPGPGLGVILEAAFDAQLEGAFFDLPQAFRWLGQEPQLTLPAEARAALRKRMANGPMTNDQGMPDAP
jgi:hypothetical protein